MGVCNTPGQNPFPFLFEGVSCTKGSVDIENEAIECPSVFLLYSSGTMSQVGDCVSCKSYQLCPRMAFPLASGDGHFPLVM